MKMEKYSSFSDNFFLSENFLNFTDTLLVSPNQVIGRPGKLNIIDYQIIKITLSWGYLIWLPSKKKIWSNFFRTHFLFSLNQSI